MALAIKVAKGTEAFQAAITSAFGDSGTIRSLVPKRFGRRQKCNGRRAGSRKGARPFERGKSPEEDQARKLLKLSKI